MSTYKWRYFIKTLENDILSITCKLFDSLKQGYAYLLGMSFISCENRHIKNPENMMTIDLEMSKSSSSEKILIAYSWWYQVILVLHVILNVSNLLLCVSY